MYETPYRVREVFWRGMSRERPTNKRVKKRYLAIASVVLAAILVLDTLFVGNVTYYVKWMQCGTKPVVLTHPKAMGFGDEPDGNRVRANPVWLRSKAPLIDQASHTLYCTVNETTSIYEKIEICWDDSIQEPVVDIGGCSGRVDP